ncbi:LytR family transcriptional regulator [Amycolatopsis rhizosphaerae]|uniref:LytR family transcriptional regulator n=1 Tax=Amycolatopsis rhizosphaerae TaxID=2053003 RepID=A0A558BX00_9PSEU|nr:LCP family protein [Amycolatopsis rhizosphaerae]TVT41045.1 LytR family transcriptional regulator [Amycolatopsis rhizosphaerae]
MSASRSARIIGRTVIALVSLSVFAGTWAGWFQVHRLTSSLSTVDVIDPGASTSPADEQNILLVGLDTRTDAQGNPLPQDLLDQLHAGDASDGGDNTDTMILVHIPAGGGNAVAFSIPRDSYVQLAGNYGKHKINSAYTYAQVAAMTKLRAQGVSGPQLNVQAAQAGAQNAIQTVQQLTGLKINHFASVNLVGFYDVSEAVGGVPVCLLAPVHDSYSGANFPAGQQTISGAQALAFVRQRHGLLNGDLDRIRRQQAFMASMAHTVLSAGTLTNPTKLGNLIDALRKTVVLDQGWDILTFAQQLRNLSGGKIQFNTIPVINVDYKTSDGDSIQVDPAQIQAFIRKTIDGADPAPPSSTVSSSSVPSVPSATLPRPAARVVVDVDNGSGVNGLATRLLQDLSAHGYGTGTQANIASRRTTVVDYASGQRANAEQLARYLGDGVSVVADSALTSGHIRIHLGADYAGPDLQPAGSASGGSALGDTSPAVSPPSSSGPPPIIADGVACIN